MRSGFVLPIVQRHDGRLLLAVELGDKVPYGICIGLEDETAESVAGGEHGRLLLGAKPFDDVEERAPTAGRGIFEWLTGACRDWWRPSVRVKLRAPDPGPPTGALVCHVSRCWGSDAGLRSHKELARSAAMPRNAPHLNRMRARSAAGRQESLRNRAGSRVEARDMPPGEVTPTSSTDPGGAPR